MTTYFRHLQCLTVLECTRIYRFQSSLEENTSFAFIWLMHEKTLKLDLFFVFLQKITPKERFNGKPVFSKEPLSGKMEVKKSYDLWNSLVSVHLHYRNIQSGRGVGRCTSELWIEPGYLCPPVSSPYAKLTFRNKANQLISEHVELKNQLMSQSVAHDDAFR